MLHEEVYMTRIKEDILTRFTTKASEILGRTWMFVVALVLLVGWAASGPFLGFSDTWQLVVNTSTTIVTFLMVFIIQNTQNRENLAMQLKLDKLLEVNKIDSDKLLKAEEESDKRLAKEKTREQQKASRTRKKK